MSGFLYFVLVACFSVSTVRSGYGLYRDIKKIQEQKVLKERLYKVLEVDEEKWNEKEVIV